MTVTATVIRRPRRHCLFHLGAQVHMMALFKIDLYLQPANSPESNVLDLGIWRSLQCQVDSLCRKERQDPEVLAVKAVEAWEAFGESDDIKKKWEAMEKVWEKLGDVAKATLDAKGENTHPEGKKAGAVKRVRDRRQTLARLENERAAEQAAAAAAAALRGLGAENARAAANAARTSVRRLRSAGPIINHYASDDEDADEAVWPLSEGEEEDEGDDDEDDEIGEAELDENVEEEEGGEEEEEEAAAVGRDGSLACGASGCRPTGRLARAS